jgi:glycosyltransferase involved in cell wall biosynthesis
MAKALHHEGVQVDVATTDDEGRGLRNHDIPLGEAILHEGFRAFYFAKQTEFYKVSLPLHTWLMRHVRDYDVVHIHALFSFASISASRAARKHRVPYIIRPLGLLNAYGMKKRQWLKKLSFGLVEKPLINKASAMHYTSNQERDEAECLQIKAPSHVIPLGLDLTPFLYLPEPGLFYETFPETYGKQVILFLSRLDPKKGVDLLLQAYAKLIANSPNAHLVIAGSGPEDYVEELKTMAGLLGISHRMTWAGQVSGTQKLSALAGAALFVLPSYSENFGIALLEAMAAGLPCISTPGVALAQEAGGTISLVNCDPNELSNAMVNLLHDVELATRLGSHAAALAKERYSLEALGVSLAELYRSTIHSS